MERMSASYGGGFSCSIDMRAGSGGVAVDPAEAFRLVKPRMLEKLNADVVGLEVGVVLGLTAVEVLLTSVTAGTVGGAH